MDKRALEIIKDVASDDFYYQFEYDGTCEDVCFYCGGTEYTSGWKHKKDCLHLKAKKLLEEEK